MVLCEVASALRGIETPREVRKDSPNDSAVAQHNFAVALDLVKCFAPPARISRITTKELMGSEDAIFAVLGFLKAAATGQRESPPAQATIVMAPPRNDDIEERPAEQRETPRLRSAAEEPPSEAKSGVEDRPLQFESRRSETGRRNVERVKTAATAPEAKVDLKTKTKLLGWLEDINLIKQNAARVEEFPGYCRNGVLLADLILRIEGVTSVRGFCVATAGAEGH